MYNISDIILELGTKQFNCIYAFVDNDSNPYYIGQSKNIVARIRHHKYRLNSNNYLPCYNKARKLVKNGFEFTVMIVEYNIDKDILDSREQYWISFYKKSYRLYNLTDGGKDYQSVSKNSKKMKGKKHSEQTKLKIKNAKLGQKFTEEHKNNLKKAWKPKNFSKEGIERKKERGKINTRLYLVTSPENQQFITTNGLSLFCDEHNLNISGFMKVLSGLTKKRDYKGWEIERILFYDI